MQLHPLANRRRTSTAVYSQEQLQVHSLCESFGHALTPTREKRQVIVDANALHQLQTEHGRLYKATAKALLKSCIEQRKADSIWPLNELLLQSVLADKQAKERYLDLLITLPMISEPQPIEVPMTVAERSLACFSLSYILTDLIGKAPMNDSDKQYWTAFKTKHLLPLLRLPLLKTHVNQHRLTIRSMRALTLNTCETLEQAFDEMFCHWIHNSLAFARSAKRLTFWAGCSEDFVVEHTLSGYFQHKQESTYDIMPSYTEIAKLVSAATTDLQLVEWFVETHQLADIIHPVFYQRPEDAVQWINEKASYSSVGDPNSLVSEHNRNKSFRDVVFPGSF